MEEESRKMLINEVKECSKCGICRSVCPIFSGLSNEVMSPRGRISLVEALLEGKLSYSERYIDTIRSCIRCTRCSNVCPIDVRVERIVQSARNMLAEDVGIPDEAKEVFRSILLDPARFRSALLEAADSPSESEIPLWQLPLFFHEGARVPKLSEQTALEKYPEYIESSGQKRIALFLGCSINYVSTDIADSAIDVLNKLGVNIFIPKDQVCCGAPVMLYGDKEAAVGLAKQNVKALKANEFDAVITLCPAGGAMLKNEYESILGDSVSDFASKVYDISEFIDKFIDYESHRTEMTVTYHDPCYLKLGQEVEKEPRQILSNSAKLVEMADADKCCGMGGALGLFHPEISMKIVDDKIEAIEESGADIVATGCPGGILFLREQLAKRGINKEILHTIQVFQRMLKNGDS